MLAKRVWLQHFWFFGQQCNEWQNESNLYGIFKVQNGGPMFGRTPRTCLGPALGLPQHWSDCRSVMLDLGIKTKIFGLGLARGLGLKPDGLGLSVSLGLS